MHTINIDIETFSDVDLAKSGVHKYVESPNFEILLLAYSLDDAPVVVVDVLKDGIPDELRRWITDENVVKRAWNAAFERLCLSKALGFYLPPEQWHCTMVLASMAGLPGKLKSAAAALRLDQQKDTRGAALIRYFCIPCKPTNTNEGRLRNFPEHDGDKWEEFKSYCAQDVRTEMAILAAVSWYKITPFERDLWCLDQKINDTGVLMDRKLIEGAIAVYEEDKELLLNRAKELTGLVNPNSAAQLKEWFGEVTGEVPQQLTKAAVKDLLMTIDKGIAREMLLIRVELAKTSVKKYAAMLEAICADDRIRGLFQYYGANRTGRWSGRLVQPQNLPKNSMRQLDMARELTKDRDRAVVNFLFENVADTLSQLLRTAFIANGVLICTDFSAIEARVIAWLADEQWRLEVFATHGKIYEASASQMFKVPLESIDKKSPLRQRGKVAELACGYGGGVNALKAMGALDMGVPEDELQELIDQWRDSNKNIVKLWKTVESAALAAIEDGRKVEIKHGVAFGMRNGNLLVRLPSGRTLVYVDAKLTENRFGNKSIGYKGVNQETKQWGSVETYGGKLVENIVQAIARDCLAEALMRIHKAQYKIVMHVHDEIVIESVDDSCLHHIDELMSQPIAWAEGLYLPADSYATPYYKKED